MDKISLFAAGTATAVTLLRVFLLDEVFSARCLAKDLVGSLIVSSVGFGIYSVFLWPKLLSPLRKFPGPENLSWLHGVYPRVRKEATGVPQIDWVNNIPNEGVLRYLGFLNQERLLINSPKALSEVLVTRNYDFVKPTSMRWAIGRIVGIGVLLAEGEEHKFQRKHLMPAFAFRHVKDLYHVFWSKAQEGIEAMTAQIRDEAATNESGPKDTGIIAVPNWASRITLDIIGVAGCGKTFNAINDPDGPLYKAYGQVFRPSRQAKLLALFSLFLPGPLVNALPIKRNDDINQASKVIRDTCNDLIREKKEKLARKELTDVDILSVALESRAFSETNLADQMMTFLVAGHETTASAMTWAIYLLCLHPQVQARLREEVRARLPSPSAGDESRVTSHDIDRMPYLNAVCNEVLRYYAPVPLTVRESAVDTTILGQRIPKGTTILLCPWATNKDASLWGADADKFIPERWLTPDAAGGGGVNVNASGGASSNFAYMTFLHGPRSCIGQAFAKAEFAIILASWVGRFEFTLRDEELRDESKMEIKGSVTARPSHGLYVRAKVLEGW